MGESVSRAAAICAAVVVAACAAPGAGQPAQQVLTDAEIAALQVPLDCEGADECAFIWRRAQAWVASNAGYKVQTATDTLIQTYGGGSYETRWSFKVVREPMSRTKDRIRFTATCGQVNLCGAPPARMEARFLMAMRAQ